MSQCMQHVISFVLFVHLFHFLFEPIYYTVVPLDEPSAYILIDLVWPLSVAHDHVSLGHDSFVSFPSLLRAAGL